jgi:hypothetical protein
MNIVIHTPLVHQKKNEKDGYLICLNLKCEVVQHDTIDRLNKETKLKFKSAREKKKKGQNERQ